MAGDWIAMRHELLREPEVRGMAYRLNVSRQHVVGCLLTAWSLADCHAVSRECPDVPGTNEGHLSRYRPADIDSEVGQDGFAAAMIAEGWLYQREDGVSFPKWDNYNSSTAKQRLYERKKKQRQRGQKGQNGDKCPDVPGTKPGLQNRTEQNNKKEEEGGAFAPPAASPPPLVLERKKPERKPSAVFDASIIPQQLAGEEFAAEWKAWLDYRKEIRKPVTPSSVEALFKVFCSHGVARSIQEMQRARANGWQGLRFDDPPRTGQTPATPPQPAQPDEFALMAAAYRATRKPREHAQ